MHEVKVISVAMNYEQVNCVLVGWSGPGFSPPPGTKLAYTNNICILRKYDPMSDD